MVKQIYSKYPSPPIASDRKKKEDKMMSESTRAAQRPGGKSGLSWRGVNRERGLP